MRTIKMKTCNCTILEKIWNNHKERLQIQLYKLGGDGGQSKQNLVTSTLRMRGDHGRS